jgi:hypothetical protein
VTEEDAPLPRDVLEAMIEAENDRRSRAGPSPACDSDGRPVDPLDDPVSRDGRLGVLDSAKRAPRPRKPGRPFESGRLIPDSAQLLTEYRRQTRTLGRPPTLPEFAESYRHDVETGLSEDTVRAALRRFGLSWPPRG